MARTGVSISTRFLPFEPDRQRSLSLLDGIGREIHALWGCNPKLESHCRLLLAALLVTREDIERQPKGGRA